MENAFVEIMERVSRDMDIPKHKVVRGFKEFMDTSFMALEGNVIRMCDDENWLYLIKERISDSECYCDWVRFWNKDGVECGAIQFNQKIYIPISFESKDMIKKASIGEFYDIAKKVYEKILA